MFISARKYDSEKTTDGQTVPAASSRALEWLWQLLDEVRNPQVFDCGPAFQRTMDVLLSRGAKLYVADLISPARRRKPPFWNTTGKQIVLELDQLLGQAPNIAPGSLSAIFCWHLLDLLPRDAVQGVVERLASYLQPGGALFCLLREPYLAGGADMTWWLESLTVLGSGGQGTEPFPYPALTNRDLERCFPTATVKAFLTRVGRREVLAIK